MGRGRSILSLQQEQQGKKKEVAEEEEKQAEGTEKKREKFDDISKCVCVCDGSLGVIPMASYSSTDAATNCSLTVTKWPTYSDNRIVKGAMYAI